MNKLSITGIKRLTIVICFTITFLLAAYTLQVYIGTSSKREELPEKTQRLLLLRKDIKNMEHFLKEYKEEREELASLLFTSRDISVFLREISGFAKASGVNILKIKTKKFEKVEGVESLAKDVSPIAGKRLLTEVTNQANSEGEEGPRLIYLPIDIEVMGEFSPLVKFLIHLERYRQLLTLSDVKITRKKYPLLDCSFVLKLYSLEEIEESKE